MIKFQKVDNKLAAKKYKNKGILKRCLQLNSIQSLRGVWLIDTFRCNVWNNRLYASFLSLFVFNKRFQYKE